MSDVVSITNLSRTPLEINKKELENRGLDPNSSRARKIFKDKIIEAMNIDNDLKMSASEGRGWTSKQLLDLGVEGDVSQYKPNPAYEANIKRNKQLK